MFSLPLEVELSVDVPKREATAYAAAFGNRDLQQMRTCEGCFTKTLAEQMPSGQIKYFRNHTNLVGVIRHLEQDSFGLLSVAYLSKTPLGDETLTLLKDGALNRYSYRAKIVRANWAIDGQDENGMDIETLELREVILRELGPVDLQPANPLASVLAVKSLDADMLETLAELPWLVKSFTATSGKLSAGERRVVKDLLRLSEALGKQDDALKALLAPESVTPPTPAAPTIATPAKAEIQPDLPMLMDSLRSIQQAYA